MEDDWTANGANPWETLGVPVGAGAEQVRAAYLRKVKEHPPDRDAEQFERIRDAYDELRDPRRRSRRMLLSARPDLPLASLVADEAPRRRFVGPEAWVAALKGG